METEIFKKPEFKNSQEQQISDKLKEKINAHLESKGKPKKFDIPAKNNEE
jgi:hypothetical protein